MEKCENCGRTIGKLETPHVFTGNVVCRECYERLTHQQTPPTAAGLASAVAHRSPTTFFKSDVCQVTDGAVVIGNVSIPTRTIASVRAELYRPEVANWWKLIAIGCLFFTVPCTFLFWQTEHAIYTAADIGRGLSTTIIFGCISALLFRYVYRNWDDARFIQQMVRITTGAGESERVYCSNQAGAQRLLQAIHSACEAAGNSVNIDARAVNLNASVSQAPAATSNPARIN